MSSVSIGRFCAQLDQILDPHKAAAWDVSGLQLGDADHPVALVGVCHEVSEVVVAEARSARPDLLVAYHPLLFRPLTRLVNGRSPGGRAWRLVTAGIAVTIAHTSFDAAPGGTADAMAQALGLRAWTGFGTLEAPGRVAIEVLVPADAADRVAAAMGSAGAGRIGASTACRYRLEGPVELVSTAPSGDEPVRSSQVRLSMTAAPGAADAVVAAMVAAHPHGGPDFEVHQTTSPGFVGRVGDLGPMSLGELGAIASDTFGSAGTRLSGDPAATAGRVAVVPGSGGSFVRQAATAGADVLVTGDVSHHTVVEALDAGVAVIDVGHAPSERPGIRALADLVARLAGDLGCRVVDLTGFDPTPWR